MKESAQTIGFVSDGTFSLAEAQRVLDARGVVAEESAGGLRFVPDDPSFPTTTLHPGGRIDVHPETADDLRLDEYVKQLGAWLHVTLQRATK